MKVLLFSYLQTQEFYKNIHQYALELLDNKPTKHNNKWADIGCGMGIMGKIASENSYNVSAYDLDKYMVFWAQYLNKKNKKLHFELKDVMNVIESFNVVSATSLLSVVTEKELVLTKLVSLLKDDQSTLILIEPTKEMSLKNVWKQCMNLKSLYYYKMLFIWAKVREGKAVDINMFAKYKNISHFYILEGMVRITLIKKNTKNK